LACESSKKSRSGTSTDTSNQFYETDSPATEEEMRNRERWKKRKVNEDKEAKKDSKAFERMEKELEFYRAKEKENGTCNIGDGKPPKNAKKKDIGSDEKNNVTRSVNFGVFTTTIFMPKSGPKWVGVMRDVYAGMDPKPENISEKKWVYSREDYVASVFNNTRSYINGQMKKAFGKYAQENNGRCPDLELIKEIATRADSLVYTPSEQEESNEEYERKMKMFEWYWVVLIACAVPQNTRMWREDVKFYRRLSSEKSPITPQMEAFVVANMENNYSYWKARYPVAAKYPNVDIRRKPKDAKKPELKDGEVGKGWYMSKRPSKKGGEKTVIYYYSTEWDTKYSNASSGSNVYNGWSVAGKKRYCELVQEIKDQRKRPWVKDLEKSVLNRIRRSNNITEDSDGKELAAKKEKVGEDEEDIPWGAVIDCKVLRSERSNWSDSERTPQKTTAV
jgi:hypothetical protein